MKIGEKLALLIIFPIEVSSSIVKFSWYLQRCGSIFLYGYPLIFRTRSFRIILRIVAYSGIYFGRGVQSGSAPSAVTHFKSMKSDYGYTFCT